MLLQGATKNENRLFGKVSDRSRAGLGRETSANGRGLFLEEILK